VSQTQLTSVIPPSQVIVHPDEVEQILAAHRRILTSGMLTNGEHTERFEAELAAAFGVRHAVASSSGTSALEMIFRALDLAGRTVLVPSNTNFATGIAVVNAGARLEFYDAGLYAPLGSLADRLDRADVGAVVVVHIGGYLSPDLPAIQQLCRSLELPLIEDAAHAHGSHSPAGQAGALGRAAALSFYESKVLPTAEGGAILTDDESIASTARALRSQGFQPGTDLHVLHANTWRMSEVEAAMGCCLLTSLAADCAQRTAAIRRYYAGLAGTSLSFPDLAEDDVLSGYKCIALLADPATREPVRRAMLAGGVELDREVYSIPLHRQPIFQPYRTGQAHPITDDFADRHICLPIWRGIDEATIDRVVDRLIRALSDQASPA
jgi:perosamine synthetase